jgi:hypothetical protein
MTTVEMTNDLVTIGEDAARAFARGTKKLKEHIEPMALGLAEAKRRYPALIAFGEWVRGSAYAALLKNDRAALIKIGENWSDELAARIAEIPSASPRAIWEEFSQSGKTDEDDIDDEGEDDGSGLYKDRISRTNEAWDTIDPRLARSLVEMLPALKDRMVWEPAAGCGMLLDQLESAGVKVFAATDIEPRRDDIHPHDLLEAVEMVTGCTAIVTNPPWGRLAAPFVRHCLKLAEPASAIVCMLLPLPWITGRKVADLTGDPAFDAMIVPRYRARWMTPEEEAGLEDGAQAPKMNHVWCVWDFARGKGLAPRIDFVDAPVDAPDEEDDEQQVE